ncbi:MAG: ATP-dependent DNA helicase RecG [Chitinophagales bacterium]|nr:ATP-dependent DNA helicase RecG [Chitinophagales bacterium]
MAQINKILLTPIEYLKGIGPQRADLLKKELSIYTFGDLLQHFPFRYVDRTKFYKINQLTPATAFAQIVGKIAEINMLGEKKGKRFIAYLVDETGEIELVWFKEIRWIEKNIEVGKKYVVFGKPGLFKGKYSIVHPEISAYQTNSPAIEGRLQPVYSSTEKLKSRGLHSIGIEKIVRDLLLMLNRADIEENLNGEILDHFKLPDRFTAFKQIHQPHSEIDAEQSRFRFKFEELFFSQLHILQLKLGRKNDSAGFLFPRLDPLFNIFYKEKLPFELTNAQKRVIKEIRTDLLSGKQMNRLLQGDVGSGKTIVSFLTVLMAINNGFQACLMVPTEILVQQHFRNLTDLAAGLSINIDLLTSGVKGSSRKNTLEKLKSGEIQLIIGTHALIEAQVIFSNLGLAVIDEQHRFGVEQRALLWSKNKRPPHVLVMTATPIPRTLAMTLYGDLDLSVIDELPPGRKNIKTVHRSDAARLRVFGFMKEQIKSGRQIYVVYPLIEESEKQDYKFLMDGYESISRAFPLPEFAISIVHGKMKADARNFEMDRFIRNETNIMVATTVIEVGVDIPNANVIVIESAERFGLSQLHQLRGRVGRGANQSYCILLTGERLSSEARARMQIMTKTTDGFVIADEDLRLRGPGNIQGTQQSGIDTFQIADLTKDQKILQSARMEAEKILEIDSELERPDHIMIKRFLVSQSKKEKQWSKIS